MLPLSYHVGCSVNSVGAFIIIFDGCGKQKRLRLKRSNLPNKKYVSALFFLEWNAESGLSFGDTLLGTVIV
jgi:hypothetical protein